MTKLLSAKVSWVILLVLWLFPAYSYAGFPTQEPVSVKKETTKQAFVKVADTKTNASIFVAKPPKDKDERLIMALLWAFTGNYGIHRIYARKYFTGFLMLFLNVCASTAIGIGYSLFIIGGLVFTVSPAAMPLLVIGILISLALFVWRIIDLIKIINGKLKRE